MKFEVALVLCIGFVIFIIFFIAAVFPEHKQEESPDRESLVTTIVNLTKQISEDGVKLGEKLKDKDIREAAIIIKRYIQIKEQGGELNEENIGHLFKSSGKLGTALTEAAKKHKKSKNDLSKLIKANDNLKNSLAQLQQLRA
ncbi:hypothetical protein THOM_0158 [Trachipleistophora hominis]|uniref:Uncharacterized protein n=1 Tax=Trachipleistophora hominis TaxID=72359 RepID=L7JZU9_TRAHO|nr:hypothetical protein THOM_0158 [Trachipleistophora hominis]